MPKHTKKTAGQLGGLATVHNHNELNEQGKNKHMADIGKRGAEITWSRYSLKPVNESQYAMVHRETNKIVAIW